jgi:hypothetical protein
MMLEHQGHFEWFFKVVEHVKDSFASFVFYGATQQTTINTSAIATSVVVGVLSAMAATYVQSDRTANDLKREAAASAEFRQEVRDYMRSQGDKLLAVSERAGRLEVEIAAMRGAMSGMSGMSGMNGARRQRGME